LAWSESGALPAADCSTYQERCENEYAISKNFYALAYDQDEVIDAVSPKPRYHQSDTDVRVYKATKLDSSIIVVTQTWSFIDTRPWATARKNSK
jgi:hypothetical protein